MKWIGQHIYDLAARFRSDVYLEDISTGTIASGAHLGLDSNNKIVKAVDGGGDLTEVEAGTGLSGTNLTGPVPRLSVDASQPTITTLAGLTTIGATGINTVINSNDVQFYNPVNNGNPQLSIGASDAERFLIQPIYNTGAQTLNYVLFNTIEAGSTAQKGQYLFQVDSTSILTIRDPGIDLYSNMGISISGTDIITDSSGTATLSNIDALDATTETTIEAAIDTLANLTSIGTIATGVWEGTDIEVAHGGTGASTLTDNAVLLGNGTGAVEASSHLNYYTPTSNQDYLRVGDGSTTLSGIISDNAAPLFISVEGNAGTNAAGSDLTLIAGSGTGSGAGGDILFRSSAAGGSGTTVRATAEIAALDNVGNLQIDGGLTTGSTAAIDNSGVWVGGVIPSAKLDADTAHLSGAQTFTGTKTLNSFKGTAGATVTNILDEDAMGSDSATALATQQSIKAYADTKSLLAGSSSVTTLGTIGTGVWEGTAIASDQQKHLMHYQVQGYSAGSSNYVAAKVITDVRAPFLHSVDIGSDGLTAKTIQIWMRTGGHTMPNACTLKRFTGWTAAAGGASQTVALFRVRLEDDVDSDPSAVLLQEVTYTASGNATANLFNVTAASSGDASDLVLAAGDIIFSALKGAGNPTYFNGTFEVEF